MSNSVHYMEYFDFLLFGLLDDEICHSVREISADDLGENFAGITRKKLENDIFFVIDSAFVNVISVSVVNNTVCLKK